MKKLLNKLILKKNKGQSDLLCSMFVITALIVVLFLVLSVVKDVNKVTQVDQIARQGLILVETEGKLTATNANAIMTRLTQCGASFGNTVARPTNISGVNVSDGVYLLYRTAGASSWSVDTGRTHTPVYGEEVAIYIQCEVPTTSFGGNMIGNNNVLTRSNMKKIVRLKSSISKRIQ